MRFSELAAEVMIQREKDGVRGLDREASRMRCHIETAAFAHKAIADITAPDIREWLRAMSEKTASRAETRLSRHTVNRCQSLVSAVFTEAVERELITVNPCTGIRAKKRVDESDTKEKWAYLKIDEQRALLACEQIPREDRLMIAFAIATGLRQGEQFNLELADVIVDGDDPHVTVRYGSIKNGKKLPPKSGKKRRIPLFGEGLELAREWLLLLPTYAPHNPSNLVFPQRAGTRRQQGKPFGRHDVFKQYLARVGITRRVRWHDLRHTCATNLLTGVLGRKWTLTEVQRVCGHSSVTITERYAHVSDDVITQAARETTTQEVPPAVESTLLPDAYRALASTAKRVVWTVIDHIRKEARRVA